MSLVRNFGRKKVSRIHLAGTIEQYHEQQVVPNFVRYDRTLTALVIVVAILALGLAALAYHVG
jgi:hypothetical protein